MSDDRLTTPRRTLQQIVHCTEEALSAHENREDPRHVVDDLVQAKQLIDHALKTFLPQARGASPTGTYKVGA
jgi:hypothetical protein